MPVTSKKRVYVLRLEEFRKHPMVEEVLDTEGKTTYHIFLVKTDGIADLAPKESGNTSPFGSPLPDRQPVSTPKDFNTPGSDAEGIVSAENPEPGLIDLYFAPKELRFAGFSVKVYLADNLEKVSAMRALLGQMAVEPEKTKAKRATGRGKTRGKTTTKTKQSNSR